ncbi:MAG: hypothetical protein KJ725_08395 [Gammaproteobacteria bacterium]|uniref:hypothetical protein n=1 Tax=Methylotuvimicrobium sp. TaxID=2822413 RepID=UPI001DB977E6|nr:hypothetical protein [Gammaproteobacteria bacterium]
MSTRQDCKNFKFLSGDRSEADDLFAYYEGFSEYDLGSLGQGAVNKVCLLNQKFIFMHLMGLATDRYANKVIKGQGVFEY